MTDGTRRVAAIDCGTNSIRLLVADVEGDKLTDVERRSDVVRLGFGVDRTGVIDPEAMARTLAMCETYAESCRAHRVSGIRFVATSASRDARNAGEFVAGVVRVFGAAGFEVRPEVISGHEEAALSFRGATGALAAAGYAGPYLVVDLGGGSTELVRGTDAVEAAYSMDIGSVRMTERHLASDPPTDEEVAAAVSDVLDALATAEEDVPLSGIRTLVGVAGSITTVTAHALRLPAYDRTAIDLARLSSDAVVAACDDLLHATRAARKALPYMHPGRVDVIGGGALVWREVVLRMAAEGVTDVVTSEHDILDGIALSIAD
ncbi:Ppx/GppA phosphatase family protein [Nostocoides japonicum]|nr:Ppx/GppA phosphatase family protein [Tetrasphaera japonica]